MPDPIVRVDGLTELRRAMGVASREMTRDLRQAIEASGEPIRQQAAQLAFERIPGMQRGGVPWHQMRTGVFRGSIGYVAPLQRGRKGGRRSRPNLGTLLMDRAMRPALENNIGRVEAEFRDAVEDMARAWARV